MPIQPKDKQELEQIHSDYGKYGGTQNDYFALLYLRRKFKVDPDQVAHQVSFGNNDYGIDAYYIDQDSRNLYLYQFKWSESVDQFKASMERMAKDGLLRVFGNALQDPKQNEFLQYLKQDLHEFKHKVERVFIQFVFKGDVEAAERSEGLKNRREDLENKQHLIESFFGHDVEVRVDFVSDRPGLVKPPPTQTYEIKLSDPVEAIHGDHRMVVGFVHLMDLYRIYQALGQRFFDRNIRAALSADLPPNKRIRQALASIVLTAQEEPTVFTFKHNGVTVAADRVTIQDGVATLHVPRLLNGAQTVSSLTRFLGDNAQHPALKTSADRLESIRVLAKIVEADPSSDFVIDVTIATNQQNPVEPWSLRAMDRRQVDLADRFREEVGVFYSRQEGAFANLTEDEKAEQGIADPKDVRIKPLAQTFLAAQGEIDKMSRLPEVFESQSSYESTFKEKYLGHSTDMRDVIIAYKIGLVLNSPVKALESVIGKKHAIAVKRAKNLIWALLIQAFLNDDKLSDDREKYGVSLAKEFAFRDRLDSIAKKRILPILKQIFGIPLYQERLADERYEFLRTKEVYKKGMDVAYDLWGWKKKQL